MKKTREGHLTSPARFGIGDKHSQIGACLPLRFPTVGLIPLQLPLQSLSSEAIYFLQRERNWTAWADLRKCRGSSWRCVIVFGSHYICAQTQTKQPTTKASLLPGGVVMSFQLVANVGHTSFVANDGSRSDGHRKREPSLVR